MCPSAPRVCSEPGGQKPVLSLSLDLIGWSLVGLLPVWHLSHYLSKWWLLVNWTPMNKHQWNFDQVKRVYFEKMHSKTLSVKCQPFCLRLRISVNHWGPVIPHGVTYPSHHWLRLCLPAHQCQAFAWTRLIHYIHSVKHPNEIFNKHITYGDEPNTETYSRVSNNSVDTLIKTVLDFPWWLAYLIPPRLLKFSKFSILYIPTDAIFQIFDTLYSYRCDTVRHAASSAWQFGPSLVDYRWILWYSMHILVFFLLSQNLSLMKLHR